MTRHKLPPVFEKVRLRLKPEDRPPVVFWYDEDDPFRDVLDLRDITIKDDPETNLPISVLAHFWLEVRGGYHLLVRLDLGDTEVDGDETFATKADLLISSFDKRGNLYETYRVPLESDRSTTIMQRSHLTPTQEVEANACLLFFADLWRRTEAPAEVAVNTMTRNAPSAFAKVGDTVRYATLDDLRSAAGQTRQRGYQPPEEPSGIRKREHAVRGHWRHYSSGVKVWVRAHKRGDPDLGRVTRVLTN